MYPANYFALFPPFPLDHRTFVAMSFAPQFEKRWKTVIEPAIRSVLLNNQPLNPVRVDQRTINDSILTEILGGIGHCRLFFADVSTIGYLDRQPIRNSNVMYEVGLAQAVRSPAEVVLFRSDRDQLLFDVSNVRVNEYDPDGNPQEAFGKVQNALLNGLREVDLLKSMTVQSAARRLDVMAWDSLSIAAQQGSIKPTGELFQSLAIARLLDEGLMETTHDIFSEETLRKSPSLKRTNFLHYRPTPLGAAVYNFINLSTNLVPLTNRLKERGQTLEQYHQELRSQAGPDQAALAPPPPAPDPPSAPKAPA